MKAIPFAVAVTVALAGCISQSTPPAPLEPAADADAAAFTGMVKVAGCSEHLAVFPVPMGEVEALVPEGFAPLAFDALGLFGTILGLSYTCANATGLVEAETIAAMEGLVPVAPPDELTAEGIDVYLISIGAIHSNEDLVELYQRWNLPFVSAGNVGITTPLELPVLRVGQDTAEDGNNSLTLLTATEGPAMSDAEGKALIYGLVNETVTNAVEIAWNASSVAGLLGEAVLLFDDGSMPIPNPGVGLAMHYWGPDYSYEIRYVPLEELGNASAPAQPGLPHGIPLPQPLPTGQLLERLRVEFPELRLPAL